MRKLPTLVPVLALALVPMAHAQELSSRVARLADGEVRLAYAARDGVCGDGRSLIGDTDTPDGLRMYWYGGEADVTGIATGVRGECTPGPVRVRLLKAGSVITDVRVLVSGAWRGEGQDLGTVETAEAVTYLLDLARVAPGRASGAALLAATLADSVQLAGRLIAMARDRSARPDVRERALRWLPDVAEREGSTEAADRAARDIVTDGSEPASVRGRAIRALSGGDATDAFLRERYAGLGATVLRDRVIRRLGETATAANLSWLRARVTDAAETLELRDRAIRVLGEGLGRYDLLRQLYPSLSPVELRDRVIRMVGEEGDTASEQWLKGILENREEHLALRDRALRMLGEHGGTPYIRDWYTRADDPTLQDRALRLAAEDGDEASIAWLKQVARDESQSAELRDRAVRLWAEAGAGTGELAALYDATKTVAIRQRLIRLLAERADDAAIDKLIAVAKGDPDESLRRQAVRRLAETGDPRAKQFIEETVKR